MISDQFFGPKRIAYVYEDNSVKFFGKTNLNLHAVKSFDEYDEACTMAKLWVDNKIEKSGLIQ